jgi:hypothetical protein
VGLVKKYRCIVIPLLFGFGIPALCAGLNIQDAQHEAIALNIEVPVSVFLGDRFIDDLHITDFELYDEGALQKIEALYLVNKTRIARVEGGNAKIPIHVSWKISRQFILIFELTHLPYNMEAAVEYFFQEILNYDDKLIVITPVKTYQFKTEARDNLDCTHFSKQLLEILRRDIFSGGTGERSLQADKLVFFSNYIKNLPGRKNVLFFFEQERI